MSLSRRDGHLGDPHGARQATGVPARIHPTPDRMRWNNSIHQIGEHGFEPLIGYRLFDAVDGVFDAAIACADHRLQLDAAELFA